MKNCISTLVLSVVAITLSTAAINPIVNATLISNASVEVSIDDALSDLFITAEYDDVQSYFEFSVQKNISFIQIFDNDGQLHFQLPVLSNNVKISKNLFRASGEYKLGFMIDGIENVQFSTVTIK
jgi:hypothetical protein